MSAITFEQAVAGSPAMKGEYLKSLRFGHRNLDQVIKKVRLCMIPSSGLSVTVVVGPTGVGKSTFAALQAETLLRQYEVEIREDPGVIPVVLSEVDAPDKKEINWQLFYSRICQDLNSLFVDEPAYQTDAAGRPIDVVESSRMRFERALRNRAVRHLILDEAVHFTDSNTDPLQYGNLLKSLGNRAGMNLLLVGAYGSERLLESSAQLARRNAVVHFPRYRETQEDFDAYTKFVKEFARYIPLPKPVDLKPYVQRLFEAHIGLPGYTAQTLINAVIRCGDSGNEWKDEHLWSAFPSPKSYEKVAMDTLTGEANIVDYLQTDSPRDYKRLSEIQSTLIAAKAKKRKGTGREAGL